MRFLFFLFLNLALASSPFIPLDHWSYPYLAELHRKNRLPDLDFSVRPFTREQIYTALSELRDDDLSLAEKEMVVHLLRVFKPANAQTLAFQAEGGDEFTYADSLQTNWYFMGRLTLETPMFSGVTRVTSQEWYMDDADYPWWKARAVAIRFSDNYVKGDWEHLTLGMGRLPWFWGPFERQSLILSDHAFSFDHVFLQARVWRFALSQVTGELERTIIQQAYGLDYTRRFVTCHRLDFNFGRGIRAGLFESVSYQGKNRGYAIRYVNPLGIYFFEQLNNQGTQADGNSIIGLDASWLNKACNLRGQFLIDDIQVDNEDPGDQEPPAVGGMVGIDCFVGAPVFDSHRYLTVEFTKITNRVYNVLNEPERYAHYSRGLAAASNDFENLYLAYTFFPHPSAWCKAFFEWNRQGEGGITKPWATSLVGGNLGFRVEDTPTGVIHEKMDFALDAKWRSRHGFGLQGLIGFRKETNIGNQEGINTSGPIASLHVDATFSRLLTLAD